MTTPVFSIIIPTYNSEKFITASLNSIISQTFKNFEILILDGLSTDDTIKIANSFEDDRIKVFSEKDKGVYDAMNKGVKKAQGDWLYFLGSDDIFYDNYVLESIFLNINRKNLDMVYGDVIWGETTQRYDGEFGLIKFFDGFNICHQAIFTKKTIFYKFGFFDLKYPVLADFDLNLKLYLDKGVKIKYINRVIAKYSTTGISSKEYSNDIFLSLLDKKRIELADKLNVIEKIFYLRNSLPENRGMRLKYQKSILIFLAGILTILGFKPIYKF